MEIKFLQENGALTSFTICLGAWLILGAMGMLRRLICRWEVRALYEYDDREVNASALLRQALTYMFVVLCGALSFFRWGFYLSRAQKADQEDLGLS